VGIKMEKETYKFEYVTTENDFIEFNKFFMFNSPVGKKLILRLQLVLFVLAAALFFLLILNLISGYISVAYIGILLVILIILLCIKPIIGFTMKSFIKKMKKNGKLPVGEVLIYFNEDHIFEIANGMETKVSYSSIETVMIGKDVIYLIFNTMLGGIVPFSVFENDGEREAFLAFIRGKMREAGKG
jgi:hypothetical protein